MNIMMGQEKGNSIRDAIILVTHFIYESTLKIVAQYTKVVAMEW